MKESWKGILEEHLKSEDFSQLKERLDKEYSNHIIYPKKSQIMRALQLTGYDETKVVILGQDPYHGPGQANGLAFAVNKGQPIPPSLRNIFKEIKNEFGETPSSTDLLGWAKQGVLMLNASLTVRHKSANSHKSLGWSKVTDTIIAGLGRREEPMVFLLWGNFARNKKMLIDQSKHLILESVHPSPLSATRGFFGCNHFIKANEWLELKGYNKIDWLNS